MKKLTQNKSDAPRITDKRLSREIDVSLFNDDFFVSLILPIRFDNFWSSINSVNNLLVKMSKPERPESKGKIEITHFKSEVNGSLNLGSTFAAPTSSQHFDNEKDF